MRGGSRGWFLNKAILAALAVNVDGVLKHAVAVLGQHGRGNSCLIGTDAVSSIRRSPLIVRPADLKVTIFCRADRKVDDSIRAPRRATTNGNANLDLLL